MKRGSSGGTLTRAKCCFSVTGLRRITARFRDSPEMYGNGWAGSTASGVSTGKTWSRKNACSRSCSDSSQLRPSATIRDPVLGQRRADLGGEHRGVQRLQLVRGGCGSRSSTSAAPARWPRSTARPVAIRRFSPATRTMKNSSRLLAKMARNRVRSSSGSGRVPGQLQHPLVERQPGQLPVQEAVRTQLLGGLGGLRPGRPQRPGAAVGRTGRRPARPGPRLARPGLGGGGRHRAIVSPEARSGDGEKTTSLR